MHLDRRAKKTSSLISILLEVEKEPSTQHTHYFKDYRQKFFCILQVYIQRKREQQFHRAFAGDHAPIIRVYFSPRRHPFEPSQDRIS